MLDSPCRNRQGESFRSIDICALREYNYEYESGVIVRATESAITLSGEIVTSKCLVNSVRYTYDSEGKLVKKTVTPSDGTEQVTYYETDENGTVTKLSVGGKIVTSHSKTDSFGRKVFDELQLGKGFVSRQYIYHGGEITQEHKESSLVKSTPTTHLVSRVILSDGTELSYGYDAEERISHVVETRLVGGAPVTNTTLYTYDALGQLVSETVNGNTVTSVSYDSYGNITSKNGKAYTYGDSVWKDLLTSYDGQAITYDAQGNPISYLGNTLTWEKGRQLKGFGANSYTYNANGIRTGKVVNGVAHSYTLDGMNVLREVWGKNELTTLYDNEEAVCGISLNGTAYFFLKNLQGDVIAITDADGEVIARYTYDAWGKVLSVTDANGAAITTGAHIALVNPYRYRSYYYDSETSLYYLNSRYYNPETGRFVNGDEVMVAILGEEATAFNVFVYCKNQPILNDDISGYYTASSLKKKSWLFNLADNFGININLISQTVKEKIFKINLWLVKFIISVSAGLTRNYKAGISFELTRNGIQTSTNLGMGAGYSLSFAYKLSWTNISRSMSLVYSAKNDGVYVSLDVEFKINHLATAAVALAVAYWPAISPVLHMLVSKSKTAAIGAISLLAPVVKLAYT